jgi:membrane protease YdiL (CAAX protease family)
MNVVAIDAPLVQPQPSRTALFTQVLLALVCLSAGCAALAPRWFTDDALKVGLEALLAVIYLTFALFATRTVSLKAYWQLGFAFFVFAVVQALNNTVPGFVVAFVLHDAPNSGNPFASTVGGTVIIQLVEATIAVVPILVLTRLSGSDLGSIYVRKGIIGKWLVGAVAFSAVFFLFLAAIPLRNGSFAERLFLSSGTFTIAQFLALSPALILMSVSNGFEEELLFRGLFLQKYTWLFGAVAANVLQAVIFAFAHLGVTYTPSALLFVAIVVFPLGLASGYLMRATNSVIVPSIFHGALDMAIYLSFLTYAS